MMRLKLNNNLWSSLEPSICRRVFFFCQEKKGLSGRMSEVNLARLIARAELQLEAVTSGDSKRELARLEVFVGKMDALLAELELKPGSADVASYRRTIERFHNVLKSSSSGNVVVPSSIKLALSGTDLSSQQRVAHVGASARSMAIHRSRMSSRLMHVDEEAIENRVRWDAFVASREKGGAEEEATITETEALLAYHKEEQERIAEELLHGSTVMKHAAVAIEETLKADERRLKELHQVSESNNAALSIEKDRIRAQVGRTCSFTLVSILICVVITCVFIWTVIVLRLKR